MKVTILCVGKLKEKYLVKGIAEYMKRMGNYSKVDIIEVPDEADDHGVEQAIEKEGQRLLDKWPRQAVTYALALDGELLSSEDLAQQIQKDWTQGKSDHAFVIGGSNGLSKAVLDRCDRKIAFGRMTYPHQLMRLILMEQIYRIHRINAGHSYHK
ncbi:23S rRNA (pseudouridine(1915)-N(3))-methyltransferase RlmH [Atopobacter sp. AH10]|uniref:23S rRNA (pseudouridine(1915)-N(3))-methyltransferase RlmH n=1 Tax=Atopobacter sp. AH10 TaxID=2315861 RepID=UPI000EF19970|nr:23S rRNA (pseudouridine(1915)-N(3))-methyltransferase RlmH [Atopobacter sp. AH10]RLK62590.1 23S rRNA (pseudouridine(1915)-N(3))-methyltransferase RlmH [Atopobacter sp. AH10]